MERDEKHYEKRRKCWLPAFSPFPTMFSKAFFYMVRIVWLKLNKLLRVYFFGRIMYWKFTVHNDVGHSWHSPLFQYRMMNVTSYSTFIHISKLFNPLPNKPVLLHVCSKSLLKTQWKKEKLLVMSNFSHSHSVFYSFGAIFTIFIKL